MNTRFRIIYVKAVRNYAVNLAGDGVSEERVVTGAFTLECRADEN